LHAESFSTNLKNNVMKKIFTLITVALCAMGVNAQETDDQGHAAGIYPVKSVTWKPITWKNGNNRQDKDNKDMLFLMGTGNGYATLLADYHYDTKESEWVTKADYTYIDYEKGETGIPAYGLYYKFTPKTSGQLKVVAWVNKGGDNRKTFVVKASDGKPLTPFVDYTFEGYINGQNANTDQPKIDPETGQQALDNEGNPVWIQAPIFFSAAEFKAKHDEAYVNAETGVDAQPYKLSFNGQVVWGYITLNVNAGESYVIYQQSSQLGFGGYEFTPAGGAAESYVACLDMGGGTIALNTEFASVVDETGAATNVTSKGSVVSFGTDNMTVEAVGGAEPESVEADFSGSAGISTVNAELNMNAPIYNLAGQRVENGFKGVVIQNGKKYVNK
jgi:hypothetical protein